MAIQFHPKVGQILMCDFTEGFKAPEMVKKRPVLVISPSMKSRPNLVTVIPLSTTEPNPKEPYHYSLPAKSMPKTRHFQSKETWLKGDMVYVVGFHRLDLIRLNERCPSTGKRKYFDTRLGREQMKAVYGCLLASLNLSHLAKYV